MTRAGQPLRFLAVALVGWAGVRAAMIYADASRAAGGPATLAAGAMRHDFGGAILPPLLDLAPGGPRVAALRGAFQGARAVVAPPPGGAGAVVHQSGPAGEVQRVFAALGFMQFGYATPVESATEAAGQAERSAPSHAPSFGPLSVPSAAAPPPQLLAPADPPPERAGSAASRWTGSAWFIARGGAGIDPGLRGGQLGGGQAGLRIGYALGASRRVSLVTRVATPLSGPGREAAFGVEWQPTRLPVRLVAEHRVALGSGGGGPSVAIIGGAGPGAVGHGFRLEGYGAAGLIKRERVEGFADGAVRLDHGLGRLGPVAVGAGAGAWGAAQRGAARLDIGPTIGADAPVGGKSLRLALDWRQRIAGSARPGSGLALSLGVNF